MLRAELIRAGIRSAGSATGPCSWRPARGFRAPQLEAKLAADATELTTAIEHLQTLTARLLDALQFLDTMITCRDREAADAPPAGGAEGRLGKRRFSGMMDGGGKREWTQHRIIEETRRTHPPGYPGFFNTLHVVSAAAFGGSLGDEEWVCPFVFPMGDITVGELLDFFAELPDVPRIQWHNESGDPCAYVAIDDDVFAVLFGTHFKVANLSPDEMKERREEDNARAAGDGLSTCLFGKARPANGWGCRQRH
jgi:hypothetical protein